MSDHSAQLPPGQLTFTIDQAATLLGISKSTAYDSAHRGELPVLRFGRRLVVTRVGARSPPRPRRAEAPQRGSERTAQASANPLDTNGG